MKRLRISGVIAAVLFLCTSLLWAESQARIVRLSLIDGSVELDRATGQGFEKAILNMPVTQGMRLRTGSGSNAEVEFENGTILRLIGNTSVSFGRLSLSDEGGKLTAVNVEEGTAYFKINKQSHDEFDISFAGREFRVTHPSHLRVDVSDSQAEIAMFKGEAQMAGDQEVQLTSDHSLAFNRGEEGAQNVSSDAITQGVTDEPSDAWDKQRQDYVESYAQQNQVIDSPYSYGLSDLSAYGAYYNDSLYGYVWRPYGVSYAWDPYNNGAWVWYPGFGYTWVSSYPWGWTPYRYGRWVWLPAYGWVWQPGSWNNWWRGPVIVNAPGHYRPPRPPRHHDHHVVWVGDPHASWPTGPRHPDRDQDRNNGQVRTKVQDRDNAGTRKTVTMSNSPAPTAPANATATHVPASGFAGGGKTVTTVPADGDAIHRGDRPDPRGGSRMPRVRGDDDAHRGAPLPPTATTSGSSAVNSRPAPTAQPPRQATPAPQATPRPAPSAPQHVDAPRPAPRVETPHASAPPPRAEAPRPAPAPHVDTPRAAPSSRMEAPHMEAPHMSGGGDRGGSRGSGGGRSPK